MASTTPMIGTTKVQMAIRAIHRALLEPASVKAAEGRATASTSAQRQTATPPRYNSR